MTDKDIALMTSPGEHMDIRLFNRTTVKEIVDRFHKEGRELKGINMCDPDLDW